MKMFNKAQEDNTVNFNSEFDDEITLFTTRSTLNSHRGSVSEPAVISEEERKEKLSSLNAIYEIDDIDLMTVDDILEADFIQGVLSFMKPDDFHKDRNMNQKNPYIHLLYQIKNFLHTHNFDAVIYLKDLKYQFDVSTCTDEAKWEILRLTLLISFLLKDSEKSTFKIGPASLIQQGLDFSREDKSSIKPSFIKGLFQSLNKVLLKLNHFDDECLVDITEGIQQTSFIHSNTKLVEMRKTACSQYMQTSKSKLDDNSYFGTQNYDTPDCDKDSSDLERNPFQDEESNGKLNFI